VGVEQLDQLGEVGKRTGQPVDFVDDDDVDPALPDRVKKGLQGRPIETGAGIAVIIVAPVREDPALMSLAADISRTGFALRVEGIEVLLEPVVGRDARIDRTSPRGRRGGRPCARSPSQGATPLSLCATDTRGCSMDVDAAARAIALDPVRPKNLGPFQ
jgi:hypothetical protein